jgi:hypothetical protein
MKTSIEVKDRREGDAIRAGLEDPATRAIVVMTGLLIALPRERARRVLQYVMERLAEDE